MSAKQRQERFRKKVREEGMVDIRFEIPAATRDRIKTVAKAKNTSMKELMQSALEQLGRTAQL